MSTMVVTPPHAAARDPVSNVSDAKVPPNGSSMWVWTSIPPGMTYLPVASITRPAPCSAASKCPGCPSATMISPSINTSWAITPVVDMTFPFLMSVVGMASAGDDLVVGVGASVAVERPCVADLTDLVEVEIADDQVGLVGVSDVADELAARVDEVALPVEVVVPERFDTDPVDGADVVHVGDRRGRLLEPPQILRQAAAGGRRGEEDLGAGENEAAPAFWEVAVIADVHAHLADRRVEHRISVRTGGEVVLLPEPLDLRDVLLAVLAEVPAVGIDDGRGVVVQPRLHVLVHR